MSNSTYQTHSFQDDDEIDLFELAEKLWARKLLIIGITALASLIAVGAAMLLPPTWQSEAKIYTASTADLSELNNLDTEVSTGNSSQQTTPDDAYNLYYRFLTSPSTLRLVFKESGLEQQTLDNNKSSHKEIASAAAFQTFNENLSISQANPSKGGSEYISITFDSKDQLFTANLINNFLLPIANERTVSRLRQNLNADRSSYYTQINKIIKETEQQYISDNKFERAQLEEALSISEGANLEAPLINDLSALGNNQTYLLGSNIIISRLKVLKDETQRFRLLTKPLPDDADRPMLASVSRLYNKQQRLKNLDTTLTNLKVVTIDEPATVPFSPIKPKKALIIALGVVLGGMLGVFIALIQIAIASRREKQRTVIGSFHPTQTMTSAQESNSLRS